MRIFTLLILFLLAPAQAKAEWFEHTIGAEGVLVLPRVQSQDETAFASASFGGRLSYSFGALHDLYIVARFTAWMHEGQLEGVTESGPNGRYSGSLWFHGEGYRPELGVRWNAFSGFNLAPHLDLYAGYQWTTFRNLDLKNRDGGSFGLALGNRGRGSPTLAGGASVDLRLFDTILVGVSCLYTRVADDIYRGDLMLSASAAYYWF